LDGVKPWGKLRVNWDGNKENWGKTRMGWGQPIGVKTSVLGPTLFLFS